MPKPKPKPKPNAVDEPMVTHATPMPAGYCFVPKGNVYVTKNCRKNTQEAKKMVYSVVDSPGAKRIKTLGIRVPAEIYRQIVESELQTRDRRAAVVQKRDDAGLRAFELEVGRLFPKAPAAAAASIAKHTLVKRSKRVGRTGAIDIDKKVRLAVTAHIRHRYTDYDALLKQGTSREDARSKIWGAIVEVADKWAGRPGSLRGGGGGSARRGKKLARRKGQVAGSRQPGATPTPGDKERGSAQDANKSNKARTKNKDKKRNKPNQHKALPDGHRQEAQSTLALRPVVVANRKPLPQPTRATRAITRTATRASHAAQKPTDQPHGTEAEPRGTGSQPFLISDDELSDPNADFINDSEDDFDDSEDEYNDSEDGEDFFTDSENLDYDD